MPIIVEVESLSDVRQALQSDADIILLDNMTLDMVRRAIKVINGRALVEVWEDHLECPRDGRCGSRPLDWSADPFRSGCHTEPGARTGLRRRRS